MAGRKRYSAEDIVRKLRRADELAAEGLTGEQMAADLGVSAATLYNWRRQYGGMDTDAAKELKELREQNARLKRLLADAELEKDALREISKGKFSARRPSDAPWTCSGIGWACPRGSRARVVGLARSTYRRLPAAQTPTDPGAGARAWLRGYAAKNPCHGFRRAWAFCGSTRGIE
ncbi:transposase [Nocardia rhamnosiphila]|uniref:transposase n=1 Tax=Nocardia rhamnosiphila TaxID=426716 RepID=UPI0033FF97E0